MNNLLERFFVFLGITVVILLLFPMSDVLFAFFKFLNISIDTDNDGYLSLGLVLIMGFLAVSAFLFLLIWSVVTDRIKKKDLKLDKKEKLTIKTLIVCFVSWEALGILAYKIFGSTPFLTTLFFLLAIVTYVLGEQYYDKHKDIEE